MEHCRLAHDTLNKSEVRRADSERAASQRVNHPESQRSKSNTSHPHHPAEGDLHSATRRSSWQRSTTNDSAAAQPHR